MPARSPHEIAVGRATADFVQSRVIDGVVVLRTDTREAQRYHWFVYARREWADGPGSADYLLLNPRYAEPGQPRFIGIVRGESVLRLGGDSGRVADAIGGSAVDIALDQAGEPEVLYHLRHGSLEPLIDESLRGRLDEYATTTLTPYHMVVAFGNSPVAAVVIER